MASRLLETSFHANKRLAHPKPLAPIAIIENVKWIAAAIPALILLTACHKNIQTKDAVRQGVLDYFSKRPDLMAMNVAVSAVKFNGDQADALVYVTAKAGPVSGSGMQMHYILQRQGDRWVVKPRAAGNPHGGGEMSPMPGDPHGDSPALPSGHPEIPPENPPGPGK